MSEGEKQSFRSFLVVWFGQFVSILGSGLSSFGLSVWIYQETGASTPFAMSFLCSILPALLFAPFAGSLADRASRKKIIVAMDSLDACLKVLMAVLLSAGVMKVFMVYPILFLSSTLSTFQSPAFSASIPMLVEKKNLSRANGLLQFNQAAQSMIAPILAGALYSMIALKGLLIVDFVSYFFAMLTIIATKIPQEKAAPEEKRAGFSVVAKDFKAAWNCLLMERRILTAILIFSVLNFIANTCMILVGPMVLVNYDSAIYGAVETASGVAMLIGGGIAGILPDVKNKISVMFLVLILSGAGLMVAGCSPAWQVIAAGMFLFYLLVPYANTMFQTVLQTAVAPQMLGRVGALAGALLKAVSPLACLLAGPLSDSLCNPLLEENGALAQTFIGTVIGVGAGRGNGLIFFACGIILVVICVGALLKTAEKH